MFAANTQIREVNARMVFFETPAKRYNQLFHASKASSESVDALIHVDAVIDPGEVVSPIGLSGSGKSPLYQCFGTVVESTAGRMTPEEEIIDNDGWEISNVHEPPFLSLTTWHLNSIPRSLL